MKLRASPWACSSSWAWTGLVACKPLALRQRQSAAPEQREPSHGAASPLASRSRRRRLNQEGSRHPRVALPATTRARIAAWRRARRLLPASACAAVPAARRPATTARYASKRPGLHTDAHACARTQRHGWGPSPQAGQPALHHRAPPSDPSTLAPNIMLCQFKLKECLVGLAHIAQRTFSASQQLSPLV